ncbi:glycosyltransferase family protein [Brevibacterium litoralis]|uniref:glycosyltransferase family protein n=1 Tax=Brevibacterium litoralis TaxID=3138935 RepID=UPI0032EB10EF
MEDEQSNPPREVRLDTLDPSFYAMLYPDLGRLSETQLHTHWQANGASEGRIPNREALGKKLDLDVGVLPGDFNWQDYLSVNPGLLNREWTGVSATAHYLRHGRAEGRPSSLQERADRAGVDLGRVPEDFDADAYLRLNPDAVDGGLSTPALAKLHYAQFGIDEPRRVYRFDHVFYAEIYLERTPTEDGEAEFEHWEYVGSRHGWRAGSRPWLDDLGMDLSSLPELPDFRDIAERNDLDVFGYRELRQLVEQEPLWDVAVYESPEHNAALYLLLANRASRHGDDELGTILAKRSNTYVETADAYQDMGDAALRQGNRRFAGRCYQEAIELGARSIWPKAHGLRIHLEAGDFDSAMAHGQALVDEHGGDSVAEQALKDLGNELWNHAQERHRYLAIRGDREALIDEVARNVRRQADIRREWIARGGDTEPKASVRRDKVLLVADLGLPQTTRYRVDQKREQLVLAGYDVTVVNWTDIAKARAVLAWHDVIIVYRAPAWPKMVRFITDAKAAGKVVFYEIDDMLYSAEYPPPVETYGGLVEPDQYVGLTTSMAAYRAAAQLCDYAIASTRNLVDSLAPLVVTGRGFLHRNGFDSLTPASTPLAEKRPGDPVTIFYGSGTKAHNSDFIELVLPALDTLLPEHPEARLVIVGYLNLPDEFVHRHGEQIEQLPFTKSVEAYMSLLSGADINLAVLHADPLTNGKSELKWFEAANFGIPSVVSATDNYLDVISPGQDGLIAHSTDDWYEHLRTLLNSEHVRWDIGERARQRVVDEYSLRTLGENIKGIIDQACDDLEGRMEAAR